MTYTEKTSSYNDRRYGKPWMAIVADSLTRNFDWLDWSGRPGAQGRFVFDAAPGTLLAYGQKDLRKIKGGVGGYEICMPDGELPIISDASAAEILSMPLEARWRTIAAKLLAKAVKRPDAGYDVPKWEQTRNERAARYSAMLGIDDPIKAELAEALGLIDRKPAEPAPVLDLSGFGF
jgi:hypothetical protein